MKKKSQSPFDEDLKRTFKSNPGYAASYLEAIADEPIPIQIALVRRLYGLSQENVAARMHVKQSYISRLEKKDSDHLLSTYLKLAKLIHGKFVFVPEHAKVVFG